MLFSEAFGRKPEESDELTFTLGLTEIVHNGSLMVDDLEDNSLMRRGKPCIHKIYGNDYAVNTGTFMYFAPMI